MTSRRISDNKSDIAIDDRMVLLTNWKISFIRNRLTPDIIFRRNVEILSSRGLFLSVISELCQMIVRSCQMSMELEAYIMLVVPLLVMNVSQHVCDTDSYMVQEASIWYS